MRSADLKTDAERQAFAEGLLSGLQIAWRMVLEEAVNLNADGHVGEALAITGAAKKVQDKREALLATGREALKP